MYETFYVFFYSKKIKLCSILFSNDNMVEAVLLWNAVLIICGCFSNIFIMNAKDTFSKYTIDF